MHYGAVNEHLEPSVVLTVLGANGASETTNFTIDTGFTEELTLPQGTIDRLNLIRNDEGVVLTLADGTVRVVAQYIGQIEWHGRLREVDVIVVEAERLLGMKLLAGSNLSIDAMPGGMVAVSEPAQQPA